MILYFCFGRLHVSLMSATESIQSPKRNITCPIDSKLQGTDLSSREEGEKAHRDLFDGYRSRYYYYYYC